jgi:hypothetical protein
LRFFPKYSAVYASAFALKYTGAYTFNQVTTAMQDLHITHVGFLDKTAKYDTQLLAAIIDRFLPTMTYLHIKKHKAEKEVI